MIMSELRLPRTTNEMLTFVDAGWDRLQHAVDALDAAQIDAPLLHGGWSAKDVLSHVRLYDRWLLGALDPTRREEQAPYRSYLSSAEELEERERLHRAQEREAAALDVRRRAAEAHIELREALSGIADERLSLPHRFTGDGMEPAADGRALGYLIAIETYQRYEAHSRNLEELADA
jgi:uncharacterized damage-inducible protein DinB